MCTVGEGKVYCLEATRKCAVTVLSMARNIEKSFSSGKGSHSRPRAG